MSDKSNKIFIGIDVSKATLDISFNGKHSKIDNTSKAISAFIKADIADKKIALCVLESTGGYEKLVMKLLHQYNIPVHRAHPNKVKFFGRASGNNAKTDKIDAKLLEEYAAFVAHKEFGDHPITDSHEELIEMRSVERSLEESLHMQQCRAKYLHGKALKHINKHIACIQKQLQDIAKEIEKIVLSDREILKKISIMKTHKGIGDKTARILLTELPELGRINKKEIASLVGVAPRTCESGIKASKGHIHGGRFYARKALYMAALVAFRYDTKMAGTYKKMQEAGKSAKIALVAIMRKIIVCLNAMLKNNKIYS